MSSKKTTAVRFELTIPRESDFKSDALTTRPCCPDVCLSSILIKIMDTHPSVFSQPSVVSAHISEHLCNLSIICAIAFNDLQRWSQRGHVNLNVRDGLAQAMYNTHNQVVTTLGLSLQVLGMWVKKKPQEITQNQLHGLMKSLSFQAVQIKQWE
ncbi:hypothetical protein PROFUN_07039 [Planoprotostelium fungivorum]|uniref:Uncharacterized protein n=1 Tax=Planoprotostelium fungivorum TaxID=1890364 RepID=A0A2P6NMV9_9EUKA|nr:hypothetical protein PROFUN_07039 [Planoprotostelium fungivorum]